MGALVVTSPDSINSLALQAGIVFLAVFLAYAFKRFLLIPLDDTASFLSENKVFASVPIFPICMLMGMALNMLCTALKLDFIIDRASVDQVSGFSLEILVLCAIASMDLSTAMESILPFLVVMAVGFAWMLCTVFFLAPRM